MVWLRWLPKTKLQEGSRTDYSMFIAVVLLCRLQYRWHRGRRPLSLSLSPYIVSACYKRQPLRRSSINAYRRWFTTHTHTLPPLPHNAYIISGHHHFQHSMHTSTEYMSVDALQFDAVDNNAKVLFYYVQSHNRTAMYVHVGVQQYTLLCFALSHRTAAKQQ